MEKIRSNTKESHKLENNLGHFTGTMEWHKWSILFPNFLLTDGAQYLAEQAGAFWLMDIIGSHQRYLLKLDRQEYFQVWKMTVNHENGYARVWAEDGNYNVIASQEIPYTDFPLSEITLYAGWDGQYLVIMLPSEY